MIEEHAIPRFFSLRFHTAFFPPLLKGLVFRKERRDGSTSFTSTLEMMLSLAVCVVLAIIGIPFAWTQKSIIGWVMTIIGVGGIIALLAASIGSQWGKRPNYDNFLVGVFFFFVTLGLFVGIPVGMENHSLWLGAVTSIAGLAMGYVVGIVSGLHLQRLGWMVVIVNLAAGFGAIVMGGTAFLMAVLLVIDRYSCYCVVC